MYTSAVCFLHSPRKAHSEKGKQKLTIPKVKQDRRKSLRTERKPQEGLRGFPHYGFILTGSLFIANEWWGVCWTHTKTAIRTTPALDCAAGSATGASVLLLLQVWTGAV